MLVTCASRYKSMLSSNKVDFFEVVQRMIDDIEIVVAASKLEIYYVLKK